MEPHFALRAEFNLPQGQTMLRIPTSDLTATDGGYILRDGGTNGGAIIFSPDDKTMLISDSNAVHGVDIFDAGTQAYQRTLFTENFVPEAMTTDSLGEYLFVGSFEQPELRVYALGSQGLPAHQPQPRIC